jgi:hypothetical protein
MISLVRLPVQLKVSEQPLVSHPWFQNLSCVWIVEAVNEWVNAGTFVGTLHVI